jgi:hypothetical protein
MEDMRMTEQPGKFGHHPDPLIDAEVEIETLQGYLWNAHSGLKRALDYQGVTPRTLGIKADVRRALEMSGHSGPLGVVQP